MTYTSFKIRIGAPAAMLLAAAVTTAASADSVFAPVQPCLSWAMQSAAPVAVQNTRVFLAKEAANQIRALDRLSGAYPACAVTFQVSAASECAESFDPRFAHPESSHQHAAP